MSTINLFLCDIMNYISDLAQMLRLRSPLLLLHVASKLNIVHLFHTLLYNKGNATIEKKTFVLL